jgi:hypoxanthine phosphoribosyltransferase
MLATPITLPFKDKGYWYLDWDIVMNAIRSLAKQLPENAWLQPIPRGGCMITSLLRYQRPDLHCLCEHDAYHAYAKGLIITVDDIIDTGKTVKHQWKEATALPLTFATVFLRCKSLQPQRSVEPTYVGQVITVSDYLVFPWETTPESDRTEYERRTGVK